MGIHYDYKSRKVQNYRKQAKRERKLAEKKQKD